MKKKIKLILSTTLILLMGMVTCACSDFGSEITSAQCDNVEMKSTSPNNQNSSVVGELVMNEEVYSLLHGEVDPSIIIDADNPADTSKDTTDTLSSPPPIWWT